MTDYFMGLALVAGLMALLWIVSLVLRDASIVDGFWGLGFVLLAWFYLLRGDSDAPRQLLVVSAVTVWGLRLSVYIAWRNRGRSEDFRYRAMRERHGPRFAWVSLFSVFLLQALILWIVSAPLFQALQATAPRTSGWLDSVATLLFCAGFLFETVGDWQLARFRADPANRGRVLDRGLWRYTRHPNYFGDALVWWGLTGLALATPGSWWVVVSPLLMTFLLRRVSGVALLEQRMHESKPGFKEYVERTNAFVPWFPRANG